MPKPANRPPKLAHYAPAWMHEKWDELVAYLSANLISAVALPLQLTDADGGGKLIKFGGAGEGYDTHPLNITLVSPGVYRIRYGTVAGLSTPFSAGDDPVYTLAVANGNKVYCILAMTYNAGTGVWTATSLSFDSGGTVPDDDDDNAYHEIGSVSSTGSPASAVNGSLAHKRCGDDENYTDYFVG